MYVLPIIVKICRISAEDVKNVAKCPKNAIMDFYMFIKSVKIKRKKNIKVGLNRLLYIYFFHAFDVDALSKNSFLGDSFSGVTQMLNSSHTLRHVQYHDSLLC